MGSYDDGSTLLYQPHVPLSISVQEKALAHSRVVEDERRGLDRFVFFIRSPSCRKFGLRGRVVSSFLGKSPKFALSRQPAMDLKTLGDVVERFAVGWDAAFCSPRGRVYHLAI